MTITGACIDREIVEFDNPGAVYRQPTFKGAEGRRVKLMCEIEGPATCYCLDLAGIRWLKEQIEAGCWLLLIERRNPMTMTQASETYFERVAGRMGSHPGWIFNEKVREQAIAKALPAPRNGVAECKALTGIHHGGGLAPLVRRIYVVDGSEAMLAVARQEPGKIPKRGYHLADGLAFTGSRTRVWRRCLPTCTCTTAPIPLAGDPRNGRVLAPAGGW